MIRGYFFLCLALMGLVACGPAQSIEQACRAKNPKAECCNDSDCGPLSFCYVEGRCGTAPFGPGATCEVYRGDFKCYRRCDQGSSCSRPGHVCASTTLFRDDAYRTVWGCFDQNDLPL